MTIDDFQMLCAKRNETYTPDWVLSQWGCALAGETGEVCNVIKKFERGDLTRLECARLLTEELPDVLTYLCLLATKAGVVLEFAAVDKFNQVSKRIGSQVTAPWP
jgi:NTP pyrophosphatase (non-canonical NTP hydrolase)